MIQRMVMCGCGITFRLLTNLRRMIILRRMLTVYVQIRENRGGPEYALALTYPPQPVSGSSTAWNAKTPRYGTPAPRGL